MTQARKLAGRAVWNWLDDRDLTQGWLAGKLGIAQSHLSAIMRGANASPEVADRLEHITGVRAERFCSEGVNRIAQRRTRTAKAAIQSSHLQHEPGDVVGVGGGR